MDPARSGTPRGIRTPDPQVRSLQRPNVHRCPLMSIAVLWCGLRCGSSFHRVLSAAPDIHRWGYNEATEEAAVPNTRGPIQTGFDVREFRIMTTPRGLSGLRAIGGGNQRRRRRRNDAFENNVAHEGPASEDVIVHWERGVWEVLGGGLRVVGRSLIGKDRFDPLLEVLSMAVRGFDPDLPSARRH